MNDGGPAFPHTHIIGINGLLHDAQSVGGMSLRAYFAGQAISALASRVGYTADWRERMAADAVAIADALIAALEVKP